MRAKRFLTPGIGYALILGAGLLLRFVAALTDFQMVYPDEQFQTLEPANWLVNGFGWKSWEWYYATRSWFVPLLYVPVVAALKWLGFTGGPESIYACRVWSAIFGILMTWRFHQLLLLRKVHSSAHFLALIALCFSSTMITWSSTTFSDTWALALLWIAMPEAVRLAKTETRTPRQAWLAGLLIGLAFPVRIQVIFWIFGLIVFFATAHKYRKLLTALVLGFSVPVLGQGLIDWVTWGAPFKSTYQNFIMNVVNGVADSNGRMPWFTYGKLLVESLGLPVILMLLGVPLVARALRRFELNEADKIVLVPSVIFLLVHSIIGHKELRFILPFYPAMFYLFAIGADGLLRAWCSKTNWKNAILITGCSVLGVLVWIAPNSKTPFSTADLSTASLLIYRDGGLQKQPGRCLLLVEENWVWTRGEMLFGQKVEFRELKTQNIDTAALNDCGYAILPAGSKSEFENKAAQNAKAWTLLGHDRFDHAVYRNDTVIGSPKFPERSVSAQ